MSRKPYKQFYHGKGISKKPRDPNKTEKKEFKKAKKKRRFM